MKLSFKRILLAFLFSVAPVTSCVQRESPPDDTGEPAFAPDRYCPGPAECPGTGDDILYAGAALRHITPNLAEAEILLTDVDGDGFYDEADGDSFRDLNSNGVFDAEWMAGLDIGRAACSVRDDQYARALALRQNGTTLVFVALDVIGLFIDDVDVIRERVGDLEIDYVVVSATHNHQGRDTIGLWGSEFGKSGFSEQYQSFLHDQSEAAIRQAIAELRPAHIQYANLHLRDKPGGVNRWHGDARDPNIIDDEVRILRLMEPAGATIATFINWSAHPEYLGWGNCALSSDFPHWLREGVENGAVGPAGATQPGLGGVAIFVNGALGGQIGPIRTTISEWDGTPRGGGTVEGTAAVGSQVAYFVLEALGPNGGSVVDTTAALGFRLHRFELPIDNSIFRLAFNLAILAPRLFYKKDATQPAGSNNPQWTMTEVAVVDVGRVQMIALPGELDPSLFVGGFDGSNTPEGALLIQPDNPNPPDLTAAPSGPYLRQLARPDAEHIWLLGLTNDMLGYFVPEYNYQLGDPAYFSQPPGHHYEETTSLGPESWPRVRQAVEQLLEWQP